MPRVIHDRIYRRCEEYMPSTQFGFRNYLGTREALFCLQVLLQICRDVNKPVSKCFINCSKAFDQAKQLILIKILQDIGLYSKDIRFIGNLYFNQKACIKVDNSMSKPVKKSKPVKILKWVRQGCIISPIMFNL